MLILGLKRVKHSYCNYLQRTLVYILNKLNIQQYFSVIIIHNKDHTVLLRNFCSLGTSDGRRGKNVENTGVMKRPGQTTAGKSGR